MLKYCLKKEIQERRYVIIIGLVFVVLPGVLLWLFDRLKILEVNSAHRTSQADWLALWFFYSILAIVLPVLTGSSAIAGEVEKRTLPFMLSVPVSRKTIWLGKYLASWLILHGIILIFILLNPSVLDLRHTTFFDFTATTSPWFLVPLFVPTLVLSVVFFASSLFEREMVAAMGGILFLAFTFAGIIIPVKMVMWDMSLPETLLEMILVSLAFTLASRTVFIKGEQLDDFLSKVKTALGTLGVFMGIFLATLALLFVLQPGKSALRYTKTISPIYGKAGILASVVFQNTSDSRLWIFPVDGGAIRKIPLRYALYAIMSPDKKKAVIIRGLSDPGPWAELLRFNESNPLVIIDLETLKMTSFQSLRNLAGKEFYWLDNENLAVVEKRQNPSLGIPVIDVSIFNSSGNMISQAMVTGAKDMALVDMACQIVDGQLYFLYGVYSTSEVSMGGKRVAIQRYDPEKNEAVDLLEKHPGPGQKLIYLASRAVSPDGTKFLFYARDFNNEWSVIMEDMVDDSNRELGRGDYSAQWLGYKKIVRMTTVIEEPRMSTVTKIVDADNGDVLLSETEIYSIPISVNYQTGEAAYVLRDTHSKFKNYLLVTNFETKKVENISFIGFVNKIPIEPVWLADDSLVLELDRELVKIDKNRERTVIFKMGN